MLSFGARRDSPSVSADLVLGPFVSLHSYPGQFHSPAVNTSMHCLGTKTLVCIEAEPLVSVQTWLRSAQCLLCLEGFPGTLTLSPPPQQGARTAPRLPQGHRWAAKLTSTWPVSQTLEGFTQERGVGIPALNAQPSGWPLQSYCPVQAILDVSYPEPHPRRQSKERPWETSLAPELHSSKQGSCLCAVK